MVAAVRAVTVVLMVTGVYLVQSEAGLAVLDTVGDPLHAEVDLGPVGQQVGVRALGDRVTDRAIVVTVDSEQ